MGAGIVAKPAIRTVAFTCDLQRFTLDPQGYRNIQGGNLRWLRAVLGGQTDWPHMGIEVRSCEPAESLAQLRHQLRSPAVLREYELDSELAWARHYDGAPEDVYPGWLDQLLACDLVIGFELPPGLKRALNERGRPYISFHIHALRFLRDLCLGATTNRPSLARRLERCAVPVSEVQSQVRRFTAQLHKHALPAFELPPQWPLLIGQTGRDSILIDKGRFADWQHFESRLAQLLKKHPGCVLLEHPSRADSADIAQHVRARFGKPVVMTNANGYGILFHAHHIPETITLASSLGVEAQAAGIPSTFLLGDPRERLQLKGVDVGTAQPLDHRVLDPSFWQALFVAPDEAPARSRGPTAAPFALGDNYLRRGLEAWSYTQLEHGLVETRARKVVLPTENLKEEQEKALCELLTGQQPPAQGWSNQPVRGHGDRGVDLFVAGRPLGLGEARQFEGSDPWAPLLLEGFHAREDWGVWSARAVSRIRVAVVPSAVAAKARLRARLSLRVFEGLLPRCPVCRVLHEGNTLALLFFRPSAPASVDVDVEIDLGAVRDWCDIELQCSDMDSPRRTLGHPDERLLGIALRGLDVRVLPAETREVAAIAAPAIWGLQTATPASAEAPQAAP